MLALPDIDDLEIQKKMKICIKPSFSKRWSDAFKLQPMKEKLRSNENIIWAHGNTYSIMRKEQTNRENVFNYAILPALIVKNCLPTKI